MQLRLHCAYTPRIAGGTDAECERFPLRVHTFGTHELRRKRVSGAAYFGPELANDDQTPRADRADDFEFRVTIEWSGVATVEEVYAPLRALGAYSFLEVGRRFEPYRVSRSAHVIFNAYVQTMNTDRQMCWVRAGSAPFTLDDIRSALRGNVVRCALVQNAVDVVPNKARPDVVRSDPALIKGDIAILSAYLDGGTIDDFERTLLPEQPRFDLDTDSKKRDAAIEMNQLVDRDMATFFGPTAALPSASIAPLLRFHDPVSLKDQLIVAAPGYCLNNAPEVPPFDFFAQCIEATLLRRSLTASQLNETGAAIFDMTGDLPKRAQCLALYSFSIAVIALMATSFVYMPDFANRNVAGTPWSQALVEFDEDHKIARCELADDCEGLALEIIMLAMDLFTKGDSIVASADAEREQEIVTLLGYIVRVLRLYVFGLKLGAVTNAKLAYGASTSMTRENTLGHTYTVFIPFDKFMTMQTPENAALIATTRVYKQYASQTDLMKRLDLPKLIGEGTAITEATMQTIDLYYIDDPSSLDIAVAACARKMQALDILHTKLATTRCQVEMFSAARHDMRLATNRCDLSDFYKWSNGFTSPLFADTLVLNFAFYYAHRDISQKTYGVTFNDFLLGVTATSASNSSPTRAVLMLPTARMTKREAAVMDNIMALDEVVPCIVNAADWQSDAELSLDPRLQQLRNTKRARSPSTAMHNSSVLVTLRANDIGEREVTALQNALLVVDYADVEVVARRLGSIDIAHMEPVDIVDVIIHL